MSQNFFRRSLLAKDANADIFQELEIDGIDHVEVWAGNARQAAFYFQSAFGFMPIAYQGPETGVRETISYVLSQHDVTLVIRGAVSMAHPITHAVTVHGDFVKSVAFRVQDCLEFYRAALSRGAVSARAPEEYEDSHGRVRIAAIQIYGDCIHAIVERKDFAGHFWPGFVPYEKFFSLPTSVSSAGLQAVDHVVGNVELGKMNEWVGFYEKVLGFSQLQHFSDQDISTEYSALMSKVMRNGSGKIKLPINEPAHGKRKSQIEEYLQFHCGPGVQHIAFRTDDILKTVGWLRERGVNFLKVPQTYYDEVPARVGTIKEDLKRISELGILVDRDEDGYLLQLFTKPVLDRPTLFFEIIQREGSQGFGVGNFKALFEAIEREQSLRGNL